MLRSLVIPFGPGRQAASSGSGVLVRGYGCIAYSEAYETTGSAPGGITIYDGLASNGLPRIDYRLAQGQSTSEQWGLHWMPFERGLYLATNTGSVAGSLTVFVDHNCDKWLIEEHEALLAAGAAGLAAIGG